MSSEFDIIRTLIEQQQSSDPCVVVPVGDDAAVIQIPTQQELLVSMDTLVAGVHFFEDVSAEYLGHKALAVNLSDMAAMAATPRWVTLALTLPENNTEWLALFCKGFYTLAEQHGVVLVGGDLTQGPLSITIQVHGLVSNGCAVLRSGAQPGDGIYVSNILGEAALGLLSLKQNLDRSVYEHHCQRLHLPLPRVALASDLQPLINSMIDLSDGLAGDLNHICVASNVGANIQIEHVPVVEDPMNEMTFEQRLHLALFGGDDYELCFTANEAHENAIQAIAHSHNTSITRIGTVSEEVGIRYWNQNAEPVFPTGSAFQHF